MLLYIWMHIGKTYFNCFKFLLQLLFLVDRNFFLLLINLPLGFPICFQLDVCILRENDEPQDIRTHTYHATCVRHTAPVSKCTHKFPTVKEVTDKSTTLQFECATNYWHSYRLNSDELRIYSWKGEIFAISPTPRLVSGLYSLKLRGCCGRYPEVKVDYSHELSAVDRAPLQCTFLCSGHASIIDNSSFHKWHCYFLPLLPYHPPCFKFRHHLCWASQVTVKFGILTDNWTNFHRPLIVVLLCILTSTKLFCQQMHLLLKHKMLQFIFKISFLIWLRHVSVSSDHHQGTYDGTLLKSVSLNH